MMLPAFLMLLVVCCGYALWRGGAPERVGAGLLLGAYVIDSAVHRLVDGLGYATPAMGSVLLDTMLLVALVVLAWRADRFWPLWLGGWQACAVVGHLARMLNPGMVSTGYAIQAQIWAYPMVAAIGVATWRHRGRVTRGDPDPGWKIATG